jgi:hypothetical protein
MPECHCADACIAILDAAVRPEATGQDMTGRWTGGRGTMIDRLRGRGLGTDYFRLRPLRSRSPGSLRGTALLKGVVEECGDMPHWMVWDDMRQQLVDPHGGQLPIRLTSFVLVEASS